MALSTQLTSIFSSTNSCTVGPCPFLQWRRLAWKAKGLSSIIYHLYLVVIVIVIVVVVIVVAIMIIIIIIIIIQQQVFDFRKVSLSWKTNLKSSHPSFHFTQGKNIIASNKCVLHKHGTYGYATPICFH